MAKNTALIVLTLLLCSHSHATDWYIDDQGSDSSGCTNGTTDACATLQHVLDNKVRTGDTIYCMPGTYPATGQGISGHGDEISINDTTNHDNITITAEDQADKPYFQGTDSDRFRIKIYQDVSGVTLSYLRIDFSSTGWQGNTFAILAQGRDTTIDHCDFKYGGVILMQTDCRGFTVSNCTMEESWWQGGSGNSDSHWISNWSCSQLPAGWSEKILIHNNVVTKAYADGLQFKGNIPYIEIANNRFSYFGENALDFKGVNNILIHDNEFSFACQREILAPGTDANWNQYKLVFATKDNGQDEYNWYVWNNIFHDNASGGIGTNDNDGTVQDWYVWNNIFYDLCQQPRYNDEAIDLGNQPGSFATHNTLYNIREVVGDVRSVAGINPGPNGDRVQNNILFNCGDDTSNDDGAIRAPSSGDPTNNYFFSANRGDSACAGNCHPVDATDVTSASPGWRNASVDFHLDSTSLCRDKGTDLTDAGNYTPDVDKEGTTRDAVPDLGAYEYEDGSLPTCASLGGVCCQSGDACAGGAYSTSSDCGSLCCVGGSCQAPTCQNQGYGCCDSCASGPRPAHDANCPGQVCCESCAAGCNDQDGDGYGDPAAADCAHPERDCNDSDSDIHPGADDVCEDGIDQDCDGNDEDCEEIDAGCDCASGSGPGTALAAIALQGIFGVRASRRRRMM